MKQVGLFGAYHYGSFGDDLMAVIFGRAVRKTGIDCTIYAVEPSIAEEAGCKSENDFDRFLESSDIFIFGGGGMFLSHNGSTASTPFDIKIEKILDHAQSTGKKVCCFSVGGDSHGTPSLTIGRERLLHEADFISFRNVNDSIYMKLREKPSERTDDIVWMTGDIFDITTNYDTAEGFGVDLACGSYSSRLKRLILQKTLSLSGHKSSVYKLQHINKRKKPAGKNDVVYTSITQILTEISKNQFVTASRLHFGMSSWSVGVPALLISPVAKARIAWSEAGLNSYIHESLLSTLKASSTILNSHGKLSDEVLNSLNQKKNAANKHFDYLEDCLDKYL